MAIVRLAHWGDIRQAQAKGLRVLVRVDYESGQSLQPVGDTLALTAYLDYLARLAHDARPAHLHHLDQHLRA